MILFIARIVNKQPMARLQDAAVDEEVQGVILYRYIRAYTQ